MLYIPYTRDTTQCNVYSAKQAELTGYDDAYSKELSSLLQKQQTAAMNSTDSGNKMKLATDAISILNMEIPKLKAQIQPLEAERAASSAEFQKFTKEFESAQNERVRIQNTLLPLQDEQRKLVADRTAAEVAKDTLLSSRPTTVEAEKARLEKQLLGLQGELTQIKVPLIPKKDLERDLPAMMEKNKSVQMSLEAEIRYAERNGLSGTKTHQLTVSRLTGEKADLSKATNTRLMQLSIYKQIDQKTNEITKVKSQIDEQTKLIADFNSKINTPDPKTNSINDAINVNSNKRAAINAEIAKQSKLEAEVLAKQNASSAKIANIDAKIKNVNSLLQQTQAQINEKVADQAKLKTVNDGNSLLNTQFAKEKSDIDKKIALNKEAIVKVLNDKALCENKVSSCGVAKKEIDDLNTLLTQYGGELTALNAQYAKCYAAYENKCSEAQRGAQTTLITDRKTIEDSLKTTQTDYDNKCKGKMGCDGLFSIVQEKKAKYNVANDKKNAIKLEYEICLDPLRNGCNAIYNAANNNKIITGVKIDMLKQPEDFIQFSDNDTTDETHSMLLSNYKSVQNDYTKLKQNVQDLNNANNNDNTKTAKYASKKQLYDNAMYANILLTALTTSVLYYVFVEI